MEEITEEAAYKLMEEINPELLKTIHTLVENGFTPEQVIEICQKKTNQPYHKLAFIGCAADWIIRQQQILQAETIC